MSAANDSPSAPKGDLTFTSGTARTPLLELYTSEGCSSCPPAEAWLGRLKDDPQLWRNVVPVAFHVDYWDNLGWKDPFAARAYTARQYNYAGHWGSGSVYTPGFVLNGREWVDGARNFAADSASKEMPGILSVTVSKNRKSVSVAYHPARLSGTAREVHVALLGCDLKQAVKAGENGGRTLPQDFVSLGLETDSLEIDKGAQTLVATLTLPMPTAPAREPSTRYAVAAWVSGAGVQEPEQATGGWLP